MLKDDQDPEFGMPFFNQNDIKDPADLVAIGCLLDGLAIIVMGGNAFIQSMTQNPEWIYALLLGLEGIAFVIWSGVVKSKTLLFGGIIIFVANILYQITSLLLTFGGAIAGISIGVSYDLSNSMFVYSEFSQPVSYTHLTLPTIYSV